MEIVGDFLIQLWFSNAVDELRAYLRQLTRTQWAILYIASLLFGFLCLRGATTRD